MARRVWAGRFGQTAGVDEEVVDGVQGAPEEEQPRTDECCAGAAGEVKCRENNTSLMTASDGLNCVKPA